MNHLRRELAPVTDAAWAVVDEEAKSRLTTYLAARRLVDFEGPHGWEFSAVNLGRSAPVSGSVPDGVEVRSRLVSPLVEYRVPFALRLEELDAVDRGASRIDLDALDDAAKHIALAENTAVFHGLAGGAITGIVEASPHEPMVVNPAAETYPEHVARAIRLLLDAGVGGPFGLALSPSIWTTVVESSEQGGYPLLDHLRRVLDNGPIVWTPGLQGGVVLSQRGADFRLVSGQDLSIGYARHDADQVTLYLEQSFSFRVDTPEAAVSLVFG